MWMYDGSLGCFVCRDVMGIDTPFSMPTVALLTLGKHFNPIKIIFSSHSTVTNLVNLIHHSTGLPLPKECSISSSVHNRAVDEAREVLANSSSSSEDLPEFNIFTDLLIVGKTKQLQNPLMPTQSRRNEDRYDQNSPYPVRTFFKASHYRLFFSKFEWTDSLLTITSVIYVLGLFFYKVARFSSAIRQHFRSGGEE
eukprot:TRINITY_DN25384_c0_g1_i1.p1 TRINITY_DN25384_c0_g1~~TRINITY_DN25384_c0_g1_i1.p1  ORF type:complete len:196 (-),score=47.50 TRINITY_DN25384_c0_g1_i1:52-639(-)